MSNTACVRPQRLARLVLVGACCIDTILSVPHYPFEDSKLRATNLARRRGGNCPNTLEVLFELLKTPPSLDTSKVQTTIEPYLISALPSPSSPDHNFICNSFPMGHPSIFQHCLIRQDHEVAVSSYIVRSEETGSRTVVNHNDLPELTLQEFQQAVTALTTSFASHEETPTTNPAAPDSPQFWFHFEGRIPDTIRSCMEHLRTTLPGAKISVELEKPRREGLEFLAELADVVFHSRSWAQGQGYANAEECLQAQAQTLSPKSRLLFCTWGEHGAAGIDLRDVGQGEVVKVAAVMNEGDRVVDTVGAGDTFNAGVLWCLIHDLPNRPQSPEENLRLRMKFANILAGLKVTREGFRGLAQRLQNYLCRTEMDQELVEYSSRPC